MLSHPWQVPLCGCMQVMFLSSYMPSWCCHTDAGLQYRMYCLGGVEYGIDTELALMRGPTS